MTAFFIPGVQSERLELAYETMRLRVEAETGKPPRRRRIFKLHSRREATDCETEVGKRDPVGGELVMAILDSGEHYAVLCKPAAGDDEPMLLGRHVYGVTEFEA